MDEVDAALGLAEGAEGVDIAVAGLAPVDEFDAELEGCLGGAHEFGFVNADIVVEILDVRQGRLTDADRADLGRFDQDHLAALSDHGRQAGRGHPSGGTAPHDYDPLRPWHGVYPLSIESFARFLQKPARSDASFSYLQITSA